MKAMRRYRLVEEESSSESLNFPLAAIDAVDFPSSQPPAVSPLRTWAQKKAVILFSLTTILLFADQNLMAPNLSAIAREFDFDDEEKDRKLGGDISLAFFLLGAPASVFIGCLADTAERPFVFACTVLIGEGACFASFWIKSYGALYICRAITGFAVGGALPLIYSILGDLFAAKDRHVVTAVVSFGVGAGIAVGQAIAGYIGPRYGWRMPFLIVSIPAIACALAVLWFVQDPERGAMEEAVLEKCDEDGIALVPIQSESSLKLPDDQSISSKKGPQIDDLHSEQNLLFIQNLSLPLRNFFRLVSTPTMLLSLIQGAPGCVPWGIINVFLNDYLSEDLGFSVETATTILMCFSVGNALGLAVGGSYGSYLYKRDKRFPALLAGSMTILGCFPLWFLMNKIDSSTPFWWVALIAFTGGFGSGPTGPIIKATVTNVTHPRTRGQAFALFTLFDDLGKGLGPYFVSLLIVHMNGRLAAFNVGLLGWVICGVANLAIFWTVRKDEGKIQAEVRSELQQVSMNLE